VSAWYNVSAWYIGWTFSGIRSIVNDVTTTLYPNRSLGAFFSSNVAQTAPHTNYSMDISMNNPAYFLKIQVSLHEPNLRSLNSPLQHSCPARNEHPASLANMVGQKPILSILHLAVL
jgi:hypothetical protein